MTQPSSGGGLTWAGKLVVFLFILLCAGGAAYLFFGKSLFQPANTPAPSGGGTGGARGGTGGGAGGAVELGIAYGTEKEHWLRAAVEQFAAAPEGRAIHVNLIPLGSLEGKNAILAEDKRIQVWAPASRIVKESFVTEYQAKFGKMPILNNKDEPLALTPMVFVMWQDRYGAFCKKYNTLNFASIAQAMAAPGGWGDIAGKPDWGLFKFGHTHPQDSNSGLMTLVLMAYEYHKKQTDLAVADIADPGFQKQLTQIEKGLSKPGGTLSNSTGNMMKEMVRFGPSYYDVVCVYENVALDNLKNAQGKWGTDLRVIYPDVNSWNDNPYYILDVPWSTSEQRTAAAAFERFLLRDDIQRQALADGFRPGSLSVPVSTPDSPITLNAAFGAKVEINKLCDPPSAEVINNLLISWERATSR